MSNQKERIVEQFGDDHPGIGSYLECMTRANLTALAAFTIGFSCTYITQSLLKHKLPYPQKFYILSSTFVAVFSSYKVTKSRSQVCQAAWLAAEEKSTYFTEREKKSTENI